MPLPTQKTPKKSALSDVTVLLFAKTKYGKCLAGNSRLISPKTGRLATIAEMVERQEGEVMTLREAGVLTGATPSAFIRNEPQQLYRLTTQTGRSIEATANHPFLTRTGWKALEDLSTTDRVAVVAEYPCEVAGICKTDEDLLKILAYLIADGSLVGNPIFTKNEEAVRADFEAAVAAKGDECIEYTSEGGAYYVRVRGKRGARNNVIGFLKEVGLHGLRSAQKFLPDFVFSLPTGKMALFLNRLFTCDGSVEASGKISYSSTSFVLVDQVQHLLLRFGIVSTRRTKYLDGKEYGAELMICSKANVLRFIDEIGFFGEKAVRAEALRSALYNVRGAETQLDRVGNILFDRIVSIEPTEVAPTYDLTIPETHNFIANDFVVHNSTLCSHAEGALFLATESGLNHLEVYQSPIATWDEMLAACSEIAAGQHPFKTIIIDTVDNAYRMCVEHVCRKFKVEHESDLGYGKGYALINNEFYRVLNKLALLPYGLFLISHAQEKEYETSRGKVMRTVPTIPDKARKIVLGMVDLVLYGDVEVTQGENGQQVVRRVLRTKPSLHYEAGDRTGRLPEVLDFDYATFVAAFEEARGPQPKALSAPLGPSPAAPAPPPASQPAPQPAAPAKPAAPASPPPATAPAPRPAPAAAPK